MNNFKKIKNMKLEDVYNLLGFEEDVHERVFLNTFQLINCRYCPAKEKCSSGGVFCQSAQKEWLESEVVE